MLVMNYIVLIITSPPYFVETYCTFPELCFMSVQIMIFRASSAPLQIAAQNCVKWLSDASFLLFVSEPS